MHFVLNISIILGGLVQDCIIISDIPGTDVSIEISALTLGEIQIRSQVIFEKIGLCDDK